MYFCCVFPSHVESSRGLDRERARGQIRCVLGGCGLAESGAGNEQSCKSADGMETSNTFCSDACRFHFKDIYAKFHVSSRTEAVLKHLGWMVSLEAFIDARPLMMQPGFKVNLGPIEELLKDFAGQGSACQSTVDLASCLSGLLLDCPPPRYLYQGLYHLRTESLSDRAICALRHVHQQS
jgi:hypothetical protein